MCARRRWALFCLAVVAIVLGFVIADDYCYAGTWVAVGIVLGLLVEAVPFTWGQP